DAGHMYARNIDFSLPGNKTVLANLGQDLGLQITTPASGSAVIILSKLTYVDPATCALGGAVDGNGNPSGCTNLGSWVFTQRLVLGQSSVRDSNFGTPTGVTVDPTTGNISAAQYVTVRGAALPSFDAINPYKVDQVTKAVSGLPSGEYVYISEAASLGFNMTGIIPNAKAYSCNFF
ncbi:MAG: hypothetical protein ABSD27_10530, partial [Bryobacteraceae bacterium]